MSNIKDFFPDTCDTKMLHVRDEKAQGGLGGANVVGANHRILNTVKVNEIPGASLATNLVELPAGDYYLEATAPLYKTQYNRLTIEQEDNTVILPGEGGWVADTGNNVSYSVRGHFTLAAITKIKIVQYSSQVKADTGLGIAGHPVNTEPEVYAEMRVWKL